MKAMILAAGHGTRLSPLTDRQPKPVLPLLNQPLLTHTLALLRQFGIAQAVVNLHHRGRHIADRLGDGSNWGIPLAYSEEEQLLGTAGATKRAERYFTEPFLVLYGDNLFDVDLGSLVEEHQARRADCTIGLFRAPDPTAAGLVETDAEGQVTRFIEKPLAEQVTTEWANAGVYVLEPALLESIPPEEPLDFGHDLFPRWLNEDVRIYARPLDGLVQDTGTLAGYLAAHRAGLGGCTPRLEAGWRAGLEEWAPGIWAAPGAVVDAAELIAPVLLGERCRVERAAQVGPFAVLGAESRVAAGARVSDAVLWSRGTIDAGARVEEAVIASEGSVGAGAVLLGGTIVGEAARVPPSARPPAGSRISARGVPADLDRLAERSRPYPAPSTDKNRTPARLSR